MTEPEDRLVGNGQAAEANFPTPPTRAAVPDWYPELLDAELPRVNDLLEGLACVTT